MHLARRLPDGSSDLPGSSDRRPSDASLFGLAPCGVYRAPNITARAVRSYRTFSPLPLPKEEAVCFLWHFPSGHPDWELSSALPFGVRTFLPLERAGDRLNDSNRGNSTLLLPSAVPHRLRDPQPLVGGRTNSSLGRRVNRCFRRFHRAGMGRRRAAVPAHRPPRSRLRGSGSAAVRRGFGARAHSPGTSAPRASGAPRR